MVLTARHAFDVYENYTKTGDDEQAQVYLKSEADKTINHQKYKRCMTMADLCYARSNRYQALWEKHRSYENDTHGSFYKNHILWWHRSCKWRNLAKRYCSSEVAL